MQPTSKRPSVDSLMPVRLRRSLLYSHCLQQFPPVWGKGIKVQNERKYPATFSVGLIYIIQAEQGPDLMWIQLNDAVMIYSSASRAVNS